jgi:hypothetical protein
VPEHLLYETEGELIEKNETHVDKPGGWQTPTTK